MRGKPYSKACENNKEPILNVLKRVLAGATRVLEIGSGTGQHAVFFASKLPHLIWVPSDLEQNHEGILAWIEECPSPNLVAPVELDVRAVCWPVADIDAVFTANTAHVMQWAEVRCMFLGVARLLHSAGLFVQYGPFSYGGKYTSEGNARFDASLRATDPEWGIRDFETVESLAGECGMVIAEDVGMPANNRILVWRRN